MFIRPTGREFTFYLTHHLHLNVTATERKTEQELIGEFFSHSYVFNMEMTSNLELNEKWKDGEIAHVYMCLCGDFGESIESVQSFCHHAPGSLSSVCVCMCVCLFVCVCGDSVIVCMDARLGVCFIRNVCAYWQRSMMFGLAAAGFCIVSHFTTVKVECR